MTAIGLLLAVLSVAPSSAPPSAASWIQANYSGSFYLTIGHSPIFMMELVQSGAAVSYTITGKNTLIEGTGVVDGTTMSLEAELEGSSTFSAVAEFAPDGDSFEGEWEFTGDNPAHGTITGTTEPWQVYDVDSLGVPHFASANCIELYKIGRVSKLRSGAGHDYSDELETCRSMKHYYDPKAGVRRTSIRLFSPVTGTIVGTTDEWDGDLWKGTAIGIRVAGHEAFDVVMFHIDLIRDLRVGDVVVAGEELGTSEKTSGTVTDVAFGAHTPSGYKLISYFEAMTDGVFRIYRERGAESRRDFIIPKAERDADPLTCNGEQFQDEGNLENYFTLWDQPAPREPERDRLTPE
jgi:hypothetical protein